MFVNKILVFISALACILTSVISGLAYGEVVPQNGLWIIDAENNGQNGRGFQIESQGDILVFTYYGYQAGGQAQWYLAEGSLTDGTFTGNLEQYQGGTPLGGSYAPATDMGSAGTVTIAFYSATTGDITLPGESTKRISKYMWLGASNPNPNTGPITLTQLDTCPNTPDATSSQFWACFSGTLVGEGSGQSGGQCTLTIGNGVVTLSDSSRGTDISFSPVDLGSGFYDKSSGSLPEFNIFGTDGFGKIKMLSSFFSGDGSGNRYVDGMSMVVNSNGSINLLSTTCYFTLQ